MALVVEDGTGKADAESLVSVADADTYWTAHGSPSDWTDASTPDKESALRYATNWVCYSWTWRGVITSTTQALPWPRAGAYDDEGRSVASGTIPQRLKDAVCEMALHHLGTSLVEPKDGGLDALEVGPISLDFSGPGGASTAYDAVDDLVLTYAEYGGRGIQTRTIVG